MPFRIQTEVDCYLLPADGDAARTAFLQHLQDPHEMWIIAYSFTLVPMIDELIADAPDRALHLYLDYSQSSGSAEKAQVQRLVDAGLEVTIGTSTAGQRFICHTKGIVCNDVPEAWCWEGSVNFSASGWQQVNTAMFFRSQAYYDAFTRQFLNLRYFAWTTERSLQLMDAPPPGALNPPPPMGDDAGSTVPLVTPPPAAATPRAATTRGRKRTGASAR